jgi:Rod binding domain-containing protein
MSSLAIPPVSLTSAVPKAAPGKIHEAARQFESLLIGQILHSAKESGAGWLGTPEDSSSDAATDFGEQQFAEMLSKAGGLGLADLISRGLER